MCYLTDVVLILSLQEVDMHLKRECEQFISSVSASLLHPLATLLSKFDVIAQIAEKEKQDPATLVHRQPFASAGEFSLKAF